MPKVAEKFTYEPSWQEELGPSYAPEQAPKEPLPESLAASLALWQENPEAWHAEWWRTFNFKSQLIQEKEALTQRLTAVEQEREEWKEAVIDALVVDCILSAENKDNPRRAIAELIQWNVQLALDPSVSEDAHKLVERAEKAERQLEAHAAALIALREKYQGYATTTIDPEWQDLYELVVADLTAQIERKEP